MMAAKRPNTLPFSQRPVIGITMGDPAGIGPEVVVKALADPVVRGLGRFVVYGMNELLSYAADLAEIEPYWWRLQHDSERAEYDLVHEVVVLDYDEYSILGQAVHQPTKQGGQASLRFLDDATAAGAAAGRRARGDRCDRHRPDLQGVVEADRVQVQRSHRFSRPTNPGQARGDDVRLAEAQRRTGDDPHPPDGRSQ